MLQCTALPHIWPVKGTPVFLPLLLCFFAALSGGCAGKSGGGADFPAQSGSEVRFFLPGGNSASERDILALAGGAEYILVGEQHDNPADHKAQAALLDLLAQKGASPPLLGLEMLPRRYYDLPLAAFSKGKIHLADLPEALNWKNTWGYDFALYQPVFATAQKHGLEIYGLNMPDAVRRSVSRKGLTGLSEAEKAELPTRIISPQPEQVEKLLTVFRMHRAMSERKSGSPADRTALGASRGAQKKVSAGAMPPRKSEQEGRPYGEVSETEVRLQGLERFMLIQSLWDSTMAEEAVARRKFACRRQQKLSPTARCLPMIILAGAGHVEYGYGIASRIKALDPDARTLLVMPFSGNNPGPGAADIYYYSEPRQNSPYGMTFADARGKLLVANVVSGSRAELAGVRAGDGITRAGDGSVGSLMDLHKAAVQAKRRGLPLRLILDRGGEQVSVLVPIESGT